MANHDDPFDKAMRHYYSESEKEALELCPVSERERHERRRLIAQHFRSKESDAAVKSSWLSRMVEMVMANRASLSVLTVLVLVAVVAPLFFSGSGSFETDYKTVVSRSSVPTAPAPKLDAMLAQPVLIKADFRKDTVQLQIGGTALSGTLKKAPEMNVFKEPTKHFYALGDMEGRTAAGQRLSAQGNLMVKTAAAEEPKQKSIGFSELQLTLKLWPATGADKPEEQVEFTGRFEKP